MKKITLAILALLLIQFGSAAAQGNYSIPPDSWIYNAIQQLQTGGYLLDLSPGFRPYRRMEVAHAIQNLIKKQKVTSMPAADRWTFEKLENAFSSELDFLRAKETRPDTSTASFRFGEEDFLNVAKGYYGQFKYANNTEFRPLIRTEFGFNLGNHLTLYTDATVNQTLKDDTLYSGSTKFGLDALNQQSYIEYSSRYLDFTFGRDYLSWGYGNGGGPIVSTSAGPLDLASLFIKTKVMKANWFVAQLNQMPEFTPDTSSYMPFPTVGVPDPLANRYYTGSRIEFNINDKVFAGVFQSAMFGGPNAPIDLTLINPMRALYETKVNNHINNADVNVGLDLSVFWPKNYNLYCDFMISDYQVDHKTKGDLKPNPFAFDVGLRVTNLLSGFGLSGTDGDLQFNAVSNRNYNDYNWSSYLKVMQGNYPIAYPYGNDFWDIDLQLSQWLTYDWKVSAEALHLEHGSYNISSPYTMPWLTDPNVTVQTGYSEPFPYGVDQIEDMLKASAMYQPCPSLYGKASLIYSQFHNYKYSFGLNRGVLSFELTFYYDFTANIPFS